MAQIALGHGDDRTEALRENMAELLKMEQPRKRYAATPVSGGRFCLTG